MTKLLVEVSKTSSYNKRGLGHLLLTVLMVDLVSHESIGRGFKTEKGVQRVAVSFGQVTTLNTYINMLYVLHTAPQLPS